jgi:tetratricopeptide (TPR) repeat protein
VKEACSAVEGAAARFEGAVRNAWGTMDKSASEYGTRMAQTIQENSKNLPRQQTSTSYKDTEKFHEDAVEALNRIIKTVRKYVPKLRRGLRVELAALNVALGRLESAVRSLGKALDESPGNKLDLLQKDAQLLPQMHSELLKLRAEENEQTNSLEALKGREQEILTAKENVASEQGYLELKGYEDSLRAKEDEIRQFFQPVIKPLTKLDRVNEALQAFDEATRLDRGYAPAWFNKGIALIELGRLEEAVRAFDEAIKIDPQSAVAWNHKGLALGAQDKHQEAIQAFDQATKLDPNYTESWFNKGIALANLGKSEEAVEAFDQATKLDRNYTDAWNNKGLTLSELGRIEEAANAFDEVTRLDSGNSTAWNNKGAALAGLGKYDEAVEAFDEAIRLDPKYAAAWNNKAVSLIKLGRREEAVNALDEAAKLDSKYPVV